jgi:mono/diheme cytochrome c family protein
MRPLFRAAAVMLAAVGIVAVVAFADEDDDERVEKLMEKTHEGKRSPYKQMRQIVEGAGAPWPVIEQVVLGFEPMSRALLESKSAEIKDSADGYVDAVQEIAAAAKRRDANGVRTGFDSLKQSCGDCHFKGGVGGELDD